MRTKLKETKEELRRRMHQTIPEQGLWRAQVVNGNFAYHAVPTNYAALGAFRAHVLRLRLRTLRYPNRVGHRAVRGAASEVFRLPDAELRRPTMSGEDRGVDVAASS